MVIKKVFIVVIVFSFTLLSTVTSGIALADLNDGLVAYYPFNGNANDESGIGENKDGEVYGATKTEDRFGNAKSAYRFVGDDYIRVLNNKDINFEENEDFSLVAWIKAEPDQASFQGTILSKLNPPDTHKKRARGYSLMVRGVEDNTNEGKIGAWMGDGVGGPGYVGAPVYSNATYDDDNWHFIVATFDRDDLVKLYIDGDEVNSADISDFSSKDQSFDEHLEIGREGVFDTYEFKGVIDDIFIYDRVLSEDDIEKLFSITSIPTYLPEGWSMISLPVSPVNKKLNAVFPGNRVVYKYQKGKGYVRVEPDEDLEVGRGYWILLDKDRTYPLTGVPIQEYNLPVEAGWYMIGGCADPVQVIPQGCDIGVIYGYAQGFGYQWITGHLDPRKGYWILINDATPEATISVKKDD